jgi:hypothetical protein
MYGARVQPNSEDAVKSVRITIRSTTARVPFRAGTYRASLEDEDNNNYAILGMTRAHESWKAAAIAALKLADRRDYRVVNRALIERRIAAEAP